MIQEARGKFRNCAGLPNSTYYKTREIPECRVKSNLKSYEAGKFFSATDYEKYKYRCDRLTTKDDCGRFPAFCSWFPTEIKARQATATTRATAAIAKDTCVNKLQDGVWFQDGVGSFAGSFACNANQLPYWQGPDRKCGKFSDQEEGVTVIQGAPDSPCDNSDQWDRSNCLQRKGSKCTMNLTKIVNCNNKTQPKQILECRYGKKTGDYVYDLDLVYDYNTASADNHQAAKDTWEPCSEDKTLYGNLTKISNAYYNVPSYCVTDNKGQNENKLAGSFLARAAVLDWGISMVYVEVMFLLLTILHAFYCTGTTDVSSTSGPDGGATSAPPTANVELGGAKPNPLGPDQ